MGAKTCTQPRSEVATVNVCCGESLASKSGCRCCIFGSCHLPANSSHLKSLRSATVRETNLHPICRSAWHLQTAQSVNNNQTHKRIEFQSTNIGLTGSCLPIAVLQCDPATQRSSNAHLGVAAQLRCNPHDHTGLDNTCAERHQQRDVGWYART